MNTSSTTGSKSEDYTHILSSVQLNFQNATFMCLFFAVVLLLPILARSRSGTLKDFPLFTPDKSPRDTARSHFIRNATEILRQGSRKFHNRPFRVQTDTSQKLMIPARFLPEMERLPDSILNNAKPLQTLFENNYTGVPSSLFLHSGPRLIRSDLVAPIGKSTPIIADEAASVIPLELPASDQWTSHLLHKKLGRITAMLTGRLFIGPEMNRKEEYIDVAQNFTRIVFVAALAVKSVHPVLRPLRAPFLPEMRALAKQRAEFTAQLMPLIRRRKEEHLRDKERSQDLLQRVIDEYESRGLSDAEVADFQQVMTMGAMGTTTDHSTNVLYNLAAYPEYITPLRDEIKEQLALSGGLYTPRMVHGLKKLDSCIKESARLEPLDVVSFNRLVDKTFTLSDGTRIPAGANISTSTQEVSRDPNKYPEPNTFKPFRFIELGREKEPISSQNQLVSVKAEGMLTFGLGRHACPGRVFAATIIKIVVAQIIMQYDIKLPDGVEGRFENITVGVLNRPDPTKEIMFKKIEV